MRTVVVTGAASGIGRATKALLESRGDRVIGVDVHDSDVVADLSTDGGRCRARRARPRAERRRRRRDRGIAGVAGQTAQDVAVNYFGAIATLEGLRPLLAGSSAPRAVVTASMSSLLPHDDELVDLCLAHDEAGARTAPTSSSSRGTPAGSTAARSAPWPVGCAAPPPPTTGPAPASRSTRSRPGSSNAADGTDARHTEQRAGIAAQVPMPLHGFMEPSAPAALLAWLVSEENTHLCGQVIFIDGGSDVMIRGDSTW